MPNINNTFSFQEETILVPKIKRTMSFSGFKTCRDMEEWLWEPKNICNWPDVIKITREQAKHLITNSYYDTTIITTKDNKLELEARAGDWATSNHIPIEIID